MSISRSAKICSSLLSVLIATTPVASTAQLATNTSSVAATATKGVDKSQLIVGQRYFISTDSLNVRSSNSTAAGNVVGKLALNDEVEILNLLNEATPLVQIRILKSSTVRNDAALELFVSKDYLSTKEVVLPGSKYFVIQNVATEKTRVYERCTTSPDCAHRLVMESDMVVGRPEEGSEKDPHAFKTWLGHARISEWVKFYQDGLGHYPHWYKAGQDIKTIPAPITDSVTKTLGGRKWITEVEKGSGSTIYGAFGWYAGKLTPGDEINGMNYQWMHGTMGWGKDGPAAIELTRGFFVNLVSNPGSSGCTRLENRAIAYLRHLLPPGTDIYRVYAKESTREQEITTGVFKKKTSPLPRYADTYERPLHWQYMLLTDGAQQSGGLTADLNTILAKGIRYSTNNYIEQGVYEVDQYPNAVALKTTRRAAGGKSGDRYNIDEENFSGYFLVDEGRFINYAHPNPALTKGVIKVSGMADFRNSVPAFLNTYGVHYPPKVEKNEQQPN
ncbi:L,D-transpeptidase [Bdellovibrio reynosensis]|uniref:L,D-transpeptidase n=1 Tax=Bdellovibrio reynosensis TaxID=2835041 RepID=A0ABY4CFP3_9BACT|nr:L,D-transpeptidase [Bdellovibrio reynosensis]UOF02702.1 L,D-transpeptidase [Bdellovibrio reynosensis]